MKYLVFLIIILSKSAFGISTESPKAFFYKPIIESGVIQYVYSDIVIQSESTNFSPPRFKKLKAILLAVFLGHFGVHRIYLGTRANVPVVYSLTLGGGFGLLPLIDIINIISSKNLSEFENNDKVIMWIK